MCTRSRAHNDHAYETSSGEDDSQRHAKQSGWTGRSGRAQFVEDNTSREDQLRDRAQSKHSGKTRARKVEILGNFVGSCGRVAIKTTGELVRVDNALERNEQQRVSDSHLTSGKVHWAEWNCTGWQLSTYSSMNLNQSTPRFAVDSAMAPMVSGRFAKNDSR